MMDGDEGDVGKAFLEVQRARRRGMGRGETLLVGLIVIESHGVRAK